MTMLLGNLTESIKTFHSQSQQRLKKKLVSIMSFHSASHTRKKSFTKIEEETSTTTTATSTCRSGKKLLKKLNSSISSKTHHLIVKMASWRKARDEGDGDEYEDHEDNSNEAIWRRAIIMGERCQPLEFSGRILYDCDGNLLPTESFKRNQSSIST